MVKLFVGGFPLDVSELDIVMLVAPHAEVSTIKIVRDKKTGICKGYAFLEITEREAAEKAVEALDGNDIRGRQLSVKIREEEPIVAPRAYSGYKSSPGIIKKKRPRKLL